MKTVLLTLLVMCAFAANSVLNRAAVGAGHIGSMDFAALRLVSGAAVLGVLASVSGGRRWLGAFRAVNVGALALYMLAFSLAYRALPAGAGALILFGTVQITMFGGAVSGGEAVPWQRWIGAALALLGLGWMFLPGTGGLPLPATIAMAAAGIGWGVYSLRGRAGGPPIDTTAASFLGAVPLALVAWALAPDAALNGTGVMLAILSGAATSGLGYALWYSVLPALGATRAALWQLTVPVIAVVGGVALLGEAVTARLVLSCALVVGGVAFGLAAPRRQT
ncbi:EamA-like transporter family protein [Palleronia marisminoris]|uniref:EamA-like transporter family protein n=1 Tax=Palleronia marisminoris TaxID=315423 RepID=A0A1Y5RXE2_9RHOB|nr:DMT family transporter [Palleronia marisminoris]SFG41991.1 EamA-like transporter family protein [Palleronia marisminoris]SLN27822.1 EamA-like transporter family protein [Palleronia marisminoris]